MSSLLAPEQARAAAEPLLDLPGADGVEVVVTASSTGLTRFAGSGIIQNTARTELRAYVRAVARGRTATAATNQLDDEHLRRAADRALEAARASVADPDFPGLADPVAVGRPQPILRWDEATAAASPSARAHAVATLIGAAGGNAAGFYETGEHAFAIQSSKGVDCFDSYTRCVAACLVEGDGGTGWAQDSSHAAGEVDLVATAGRAAGKANKGGTAVPADPGRYEVVLEPAAVASLLEYLAYAGMGAKQVIEGESFLAAHMGQMVAAESVTVADDAAHPLSLGIGFDFEGCPRRRVAVIDGGRAATPVTDLRTARQLGLEPTGHYSGSAAFGPYASNVVLGPGDASTEELIGGVDDGLLVTRFHYVNVLDRPSTLLTGMTRDGTFRIRGGEIDGPVHNLRFSQSVLGALAQTVRLGRDLQAFVPEFGGFGSTVAPALHVSEFTFTSRTSH